MGGRATEMLSGGCSAARARGSGIEPLFPLWGRPTRALIQEMIDGGLRARVTCVDPRQVSGTLCGSEIDRGFVDALPEGVDPCGENGEFHTFVYSGPIMGEAVRLRSCGIHRQDMAAWVDWATV